MNLKELTRLKNALEDFSSDVQIALNGNEFVISGTLQSIKAPYGADTPKTPVNPADRSKEYNWTVTPPYPSASTTVPGYMAVGGKTSTELDEMARKEKEAKKYQTDKNLQEQERKREESVTELKKFIEGLKNTELEEVKKNGDNPAYKGNLGAVVEEVKRKVHERIMEIEKEKSDEQITEYIKGKNLKPGLYFVKL